MVHGVGVLDWTANSPDLNHIENLWGIVKRQINHVIRLLPENPAVLKSWRIPNELRYFDRKIQKRISFSYHTELMRYMSDSLTPSLSACEEKSKAMASRVPHTRAYGNITSNTGAQQIHSDELNNSTDHLTESETLLRSKLMKYICAKLYTQLPTSKY